MDQEKVGRFIAQRRKQNGFTQAALAERLGITDRAVSKWENGRCLPDASIMLPLCELLGISVNELLTGERLDMEQYKDMAERHLVEMRAQEEAANRKLLSLEWVVGILGTVAYLMGMLGWSVEEMPMPWRTAFLVTGIASLILGASFALRIEQIAGYYECPACGRRYVPTMRSVFLAPHFGRTRWMKCPGCGRRSWQKKVLTK